MAAPILQTGGNSFYQTDLVICPKALVKAFEAILLSDLGEYEQVLECMKVRNRHMPICETMEDQRFMDREEALIQALISKLGRCELSSAERTYIDDVYTYLGLGDLLP